MANINDVYYPYEFASCEHCGRRLCVDELEIMEVKTLTSRREITICYDCAATLCVQCDALPECCECAS